MFTRKPSKKDTQTTVNSSSIPSATAAHVPMAYSPMRMMAASPPPETEPHYEEGLVVIGKGTRVHGRIGDCHTLDVHGIIEADVVADMLIVRAGGGIKGTVQTDNAQVHGVVEGTLVVHEHLDIRSTGQVTGEISYRTLAIEAGAQLRGNIMCSEPDPQLDTMADQEPGPAGNVIPMMAESASVETHASPPPLFKAAMPVEKTWGQTT